MHQAPERSTQSIDEPFNKLHERHVNSMIPAAADGTKSAATENSTVMVEYHSVCTGRLWGVPYAAWSGSAPSQIRLRVPFSQARDSRSSPDLIALCLSPTILIP